MRSDQGPLADRLGLRVPLVVAPMAGGPTTPALVIASSRAGALGSIGAAYLSPSEIDAFVSEVRGKTDRPIGINLFLPHREPRFSADQLALAVEATRPFREELGLPDPHLAGPYEEDFDSQFESVLRIRPALFSTVFGVLRAEYVRAAQAQGILVAGTATTPEEAQAQENSGVDAIVLQGIEGGGHRGIFDPDAPDPNIPALDLLAACKRKLKVPLIAAGGIMDRSGIEAALRAGASLVQLGTAFLACQEAGTSTPYRKKLLESPNRETRTTRAFSGRLARGLVNRFMTELEREPGAILPFPAQNKFTRDLRTACAKAGSSDCLSLWSGTGQGELWTGSAAELIRSFFDT